MFDVCVLFFGHKLKIQRQIENKYSNLQIKIHKKVMMDNAWKLSFVIQSSHACLMSREDDVKKVG